MPSQYSAADVASIEAISVVFAAGLVWLSAMVQHLSNILARGPQYVIGDRSVPPSQVGFFGRATRTLANNIESALMWVPPVVAILVLHRSNWISHLAAGTYIAARTVFVLSYWLKVPVIRSLAWFVGMICCAVVALLSVAPVS